MAKKKSHKAKKCTPSSSPTPPTRLTGGAKLITALDALSIKYLAPPLPVTKSKMARERKNSVASEFSDYFGNESQLANWQRLCGDLGLDERLPSISKCKKALRGVWVNIRDFLDAKRSGTKVHHFENERALAKYTREHRDKIFPKERAKEGGPARVLLAHIFRR